MYDSRDCVPSVGECERTFPAALSDLDAGRVRPRTAPLRSPDSSRAARCAVLPVAKFGLCSTGGLTEGAGFGIASKASMSAPPAILRHQSDAWLDLLSDRLAGGAGVRLACPSVSAAGYLAWLCFCELKRHVVVVAESPRVLDDLHPSLCAFAESANIPVLYYPAQDLAPGNASDAELDVSGARMECLQQLASATGPLIIATCVQALQQLTWPPTLLRQKVRRLEPGAECELEALALEIESVGYEFVPEVQYRGQAARRGGILDAWPPALPSPCRIEFFGNVVESLRAFDPGTQLSTGRIDRVELGPVGEWQRAGAPDGAPAPVVAPFLTHLPEPALVMWMDLEGILTGGSGQGLSGIESHALAYEEAAQGVGANDRLLPWADLLDMLGARAQTGQVWLASAADETADVVDAGLESLEQAPTYRQQTSLAPDVMQASRQRLLERLKNWNRSGGEVHFFFATEGARNRFNELNPEHGFHLRLGRLSDGFFAPSRRLAVVSEANWLGRRKIATGRYDPRARRRRHRAVAGATITDHLSLEPGDLVVHVQHGIGRYLGLYHVEFHGQKRESLAIEYADGGRLFVPVSQAHLLSRYIGMGGRGRVELHRLGGGRWKKEKEAAERAVADLAAMLLETQALRSTRPGFAFEPDGAWQQEFEAAFPYQETEDQDRAIYEVKADMENPRPMDRLICGDVGYGKTEVALRATFKAVLGGRQVVLLAPTTVLAQQHYDLFAERMSAYPVRVELLCRFRTAAEQTRVARETGEGKVDIVIGTHRLLQADVSLPRLGLVIIDEEQRFGVAHKEWLKRHSQMADVLTLTATPIPRTLYMSLTGVKDISVIQTPPRERRPVETALVDNKDGLVRAAIIRELQRGGQTYYLHNRVKTIDGVHDRLKRLVPEARIAVGHGRMPTSELAGVMRQFAAGEYDVLLCTTIIESGVDIPNVNTILIDRADRFGMADLYQLRGRVGRSSRKGYAYLMLPEGGRIPNDARKRLKAILEHTDLGAGFQLAMRDLEVRGSGNLLGAEQSGHIAAIGFDLYCRLLRETVDSMEGKSASAATGRTRPSAIRTDVDLKLDFLDEAADADSLYHAATLPAEYIEDERVRLDQYRALAASATPHELRALRAQWRDRFGALPASAERLISLALIRLAAAELGAQSIEVRQGRVMIARGGDYLMSGHQFPRLKAVELDAALAELLAMLKKLRREERSAV